MRLTIYDHGNDSEKVIQGSIEEVRQDILALGVGHEDDTIEELVQQLNDAQNLEATMEFGPKEEQDDPQERILNLKNRSVSVHELREALHDEDPEVRQAAASHPGMTDGLLHEALQHEDPHTRETALMHPGINEAHLEAVLFDPELRHMVAAHPALTHQQSARLVNDHLTAEYLRDDLLKNVGYVEFPNFGQPGPSEAGAMSQKQIGLRLKLRGFDAKDYPGMSGVTLGTVGRTKTVSPKMRGFVAAYRTTRNPQWQAARAHETQHGVLKRFAQDWGRQTADAALKHTMSGLSFVEKRALRGLVSSPATDFQVDDPEEHLAYAQSYLNDKNFRHAIHTHLRLRQPHQQRAFAATVKSAMQKMRSAAANLRPEHIGATRKSEPEVIAEYLGKVMSGYLNRDLDPEIPSSKTKFESVESREVHPGIYHHVYKMPHMASIGYRPMIHAISHDPSPFNTDAIRASARVGEYDAKQFSQDDDTRKYKHPFTEGPMAMVNYVATTPGWRGHGYGGHLYESMARHHGQLVSDTMVSDDAQKRWKALHAHPDFEGGMGAVSTLNTAPLNWVKHKGEKPLPHKVLTNPAEHTLGEMKELHDPTPMKKTSPPPAFPRLHVGPQRRESRVLADERELHAGFRRLHHADMQLQHQDYERDPNAHMGNLAVDAAKYRGKLSADRAAAKENSMHGWNFTGAHPYRQSAVLGGKFLPQKSWLHDDEAKDAYVRSNLQHEDLHGLFGLVERKYGRKGRTQLAANIVNAMPKEHQYALTHLLHGIAGNSYDERAPSHVNEEMLAHLMNYMNGEPMRRRYHANSNHSPEEERIHNKLLKQAYRHLQAISARASEKWTQGPAELSKSVPPEGSENSVEDMSAPDEPSQKHLALASINFLGKTEELAKMAMIHDDPSKPMTVWRVQNEQGEGPYGWGSKKPKKEGVAPFVKPAPGQPAPALREDEEVSPVQKLRQMKIPHPGGPGPMQDFSPDEPYTKAKYGFESPEHAHHWFGGEAGLNALAEQGYRLTPVLARQVWRGNSGRQVIFHPHDPDLAALTDAERRHSEVWGIPPKSYRKSDEDSFSPDVNDQGEEMQAPSQKELALASINRMKPEHRKMAKDWFDYVHGNIGVRPRVTPAIERHLARFGVVDPAGYPYDEGGYSLERPVTTKKVFNKQPDALREHRERNNWLDYNKPFQRSEYELEPTLFKAEEDLYNAVAVLQAGASGLHEPLLLAAAFLGGQAPDVERFRSALALDMEPEAAALKSVGLEPTVENLAGLQAVLAVQTDHAHPMLKGEEHQVSGEDGPLAEVIRNAMEAGDAKPVAFKGKHTGGMQVVSDEGTKHRFLLKPGSGELSPSAGVREETASQTQREVAFYECAKVFGLDNWLPPTALLTIDGKETAVFHLLPETWVNLNELKKDPHALVESLSNLAETGVLHQWAIMDFVLGNPDRHGGNVMVGQKSDGYPMRLIDHGSTFAGEGFDPSKDTKSFIPFYLRAFAGSRWKDLAPKDRLKFMPELKLGQDENLRQWVESIDPQALTDVMSKYGIRAEPSLLRLNAVKHAASQAENLSRAVDEMWLGL